MSEPLRFTRRGAVVTTEGLSRMTLEEAIKQGFVGFSDAPPEPATEPTELERVAREIVFAFAPYFSAWEADGPSVDGEDLHRRLREALGITEDEWRESSER